MKTNKHEILASVIEPKMGLHTDSGSTYLCPAELVVDMVRSRPDLWSFESNTQPTWLSTGGLLLWRVFLLRGVYNHTLTHCLLVVSLSGCNLFYVNNVNKHSAILAC